MRKLVGPEGAEEDLLGDRGDVPCTPPRGWPGGLGTGALSDQFVSLGAKFSPAEEEESAGSVPKRKRKKKKKNHLRPEHLGPGGEATCPEQNGSRQPEAGPGRAQEASVAELGTVATSWPREQSGSEPASVHSRRRRLRKRSLRAQVESPEAAALAGGAPVLKRTRELGALLVNGGGPPTLAWPLPPPASPADRGDCPATLPQGGKLKKRRRESGGHDPHDLSAQKAAVLKKRKKVKEMSKWAEHRGVKLVQALVRRPGPGQGAGAPGRECRGHTCSAACVGRTGDSQPRAQGAVMAPDSLYHGASSDPLGGLLCAPSPHPSGSAEARAGPASVWGPVPVASPSR